MTSSTRARVLARDKGTYLVQVETTTTGTSRLYAVSPGKETVRYLGHGHPTPQGLQTRKQFPKRLRAAFDARYMLQTPRTDTETIPASDHADHSTRLCLYWHSSNGQGSLDMGGAPVSEAIKQLLSQCSDAAEREAIFAGTLEVVA